MASTTKAAVSTSPRLRVMYKDTISKELMKELELKNVHQIPRVEKIVVNVGLGRAKDDKRLMEIATNTLRKITGQQPIETVAKNSIAGFKLREGMAIGCKVTLRGVRMYDFVDKLFNVALPRVRDFRGISPRSFDGRGNFTIGLREQLIFPEIEYSKVEKILGMDIVIVTTAKTDEEAKELLTLMGLPFRAA
ncbi:MAG TPA: 50S ribosomal protein L5 [Bacillota bacterium]|nr:50S ribosomal protein L5 [Bacillota bacterium]